MVKQKVKVEKAEAGELDVLFQKVSQHCKGLSLVTEGKLFGCNVWKVDGNIFAMVWKTGRIALKLSNVDEFAKLEAMNGTDPWTAGNKTMKHWLLLPESLATHDLELKKRLKIAHKNNKTLE